MNKTLHTIYIGLFFLIGISSTLLISIQGFEYYSTQVEERPFQTEHSSLKPSGSFGHGFGIIGTLMMIFGVAIYMVRKRYRKLFNLGYLKYWLEFHIFMCTVGPILVLYHTAFKFGGIVAVSFWSMVAVVLSGFIGRFIYIQIPRTIRGNEIDVQELNKMSEDLSSVLRNKFSVNGNFFKRLEGISSTDKYKSITLGASFIFVMKDYFIIRSAIKGLKKDLINSSVPKSQMIEILTTAKSKLLIMRRIGHLRTMQKLFRYWHIVHLPFAITMFVIMLVHVAVTIMFGYKWIF